MKKLKMEKEYWFPSPTYVNVYGRKRSIAKIFNLEYDDSDIFSSQILWGSTTAQPRKTFTIPVGPKSKKNMLESIKSFIKKYK